MICNDTIIILVVVIFLLMVIYIMSNYQQRSETFDDTNPEQVTVSIEDLRKVIGTPQERDTDMIHKSAIPPQVQCPPPRSEDADYVKKSSIPPCPKCEPCVAPKTIIKYSGPENCKQTIKSVPVFITKTITLNSDGSVKNEKVEKSLEGDMTIVNELINKKTLTAKATQLANNDTDDEPWWKVF